ncbi:hypothetical protein [Thiorhodospira sibirica]|uniref:hypothetical protein n=1 Tax=Thiorhodospira sibirica TaxID=154347 RepID=UPI00022C5E4E|nr:hypothetical protein [Thiorhodospira sibirica]
MTTPSHALAWMHTDTPRRSALLALPGQGDPFDRYSLACTLVLALHEVEHTLQPSLNASLGLSVDLGARSTRYAL